MTIKKWSGSAWANQAPKTTASQIFTDTTFATSIFENNKVKVAYLPNEVFDSLRFGSVVYTDLAADFAEYLQDAYDSLVQPKTMVGVYLVAGAVLSIANQATGIQGTVTPDKYWKWTFINQDSAVTGSPTSSGTMEIGDWVVIESITGLGTSGSPFVLFLSVINNTYEIATATTNGIVKLFSSTSQSVAAESVSATTGRTYGIQNNASGQLVVNVPWVNTVYTHPTQTAINANATDDGINVIDSVTVDTSGHVTAVGTRNLSAATASVPGHMTAAQASKLDGIASGAQVNVATDLSYNASTRELASSTGTNVTLPEVVAAGNSGLMTGAALTKLNGIATGANNYVHPNHSGDVTSSGDGATTIAAAAVTFAKFQNSAATGLSVIGRSANSAGVFAEIAAGTDGHVLTRASSTSLTFGQVQAAGIANNAVTTDKINAGAVSLAKMANLAANSIIGNNTGSAATPLALTPANVRTLIQTKQFFVQTATPSGTIETDALWYDIN